MNESVWSNLFRIFQSSLIDLWTSFIEFTPRLLIAIILFIIGWVLGALVARAFEEVFRALKIDQVFKSVGADNFFRRAGIRLDSGYFVGQVMKWFVIILFLFPSLELVGLSSIANFLKEDVLLFLPKVIVAAFILIIAAFVADALSKAVNASAKSLNLRSARMLGSITRYAIWVFAFIIALGQLGVAPAFMQILFSGIIAMVALGGALAFGLGGREHASRLLSKIGEDMSHKG